jgi:hypothetical protein
VGRKRPFSAEKILSAAQWDFCHALSRSAHILEKARTVLEKIVGRLRTQKGVVSLNATFSL